MEKLKEKFAQKMLDEKLDFLPLKESIELFDSGIELETRFNWIMNTEEISDEPYNLTTEELFKEYDEVFGLDNSYALRIGDTEDFDEFTYTLCPAVTYIDLIK